MISIEKHTRKIRDKNITKMSLSLAKIKIVGSGKKKTKVYLQKIFQLVFFLSFFLRFNSCRVSPISLHFFKVQNKQYFVMEQYKTYSQAKEDCRIKFQGSLAVIKDNVPAISQHLLVVEPRK